MGPGLAPFGVSGTLSDPVLTVQTRIGGEDRVVSQNDDWAGDSVLTSVIARTGAFHLETQSKDAAILATLAPGSYTAKVAGANGTRGVALIELYEVQ